MILDEVICKAFPTTLKGARRVWFSKIPLGTIANFEKLSHSFVRHFIGGQRHRKAMGHLLSIKQEEGESLRLYVTRINKEVLQVDKAEDQVILVASKLDWHLRISSLLLQMSSKDGSKITSQSSEIYERRRHVIFKRDY